MFTKKDSGYREGFDTLIGANTTFEGNIESEGSVRIDGKIKGDLKINGDVIIGKDAHVAGNVVASNISLSGTVEGNIHSTGILKILSSSRLLGDIEARSFVADEGAIFQGKCNMLDMAADAPSDKQFAKKAAKDYKKSTVLDQIYEEKEKSNALKAE